MSELSFRHRVEEIVRGIPLGYVMTYGQIASLAGNPLASRVVGGIAHFGDLSIPWHRVVNKQGGLASGYPGGKANHKKQLTGEGLMVDKNYKVEINKYIWWPAIR